MSATQLRIALEKSTVLHLGRILPLVVFFVLFPKGRSHAQGNNAEFHPPRLSVLQSKNSPAKVRITALHQAFASKDLLSTGERTELINATTGIAKDKSEDARLRADSIRIAGDVSMALLHEKALTREEIALRFNPMLDVAADATEPARVRHNTIIALGKLGMTEVIPVVRKLLSEKANYNRPEITRSACLVMAELASPDAVESVGAVLSQTTNASVFGSAAYALGRANSPKALSVLLANRSRLGDNLSVDNAVEAMQEHVFQSLEHPTSQTLDAIRATKSLWRKEQKERYAPLLLEIVKSKSFAAEVRRQALSRLLEDAATLSLNEEKEQLAAYAPLIQGDEIFEEQAALIKQKLDARILLPTSVELQPAK